MPTNVVHARLTLYYLIAFYFSNVQMSTDRNIRFQSHNAQLSKTIFEVKGLFVIDCDRSFRSLHCRWRSFRSGIYANDRATLFRTFAVIVPPRPGELSDFVLQIKTAMAESTRIFGEITRLVFGIPTRTILSFRNIAFDVFRRQQRGTFLG